MTRAILAIFRRLFAARKAIAWGETAMALTPENLVEAPGRAAARPSPRLRLAMPSEAIGRLSPGPPSSRLSPIRLHAIGAGRLHGAAVASGRSARCFCCDGWALSRRPLTCGNAGRGGRVRACGQLARGA